MKKVDEITEARIMKAVREGRIIDGREPTGSLEGNAMTFEEWLVREHGCNLLEKKMEQEYMVALVAIEDGHPEYGPFPITANNATNAVEIAFRFHHFPTNMMNTVVAVQLPDSNVAITFSYGTVGF